MEIREAKDEEFDHLANIWLDSSIQAHSFIEPDYWIDNMETVRGFYLPLSENIVVIEKGEIKGFVSLMGNYMSALFILPNSQRKGYGRLLIDRVKRDRERIQLKVYQKNSQAHHFYERNDFKSKQHSTDEPTGEKELMMEWQRDDSNKK